MGRQSHLRRARRVLRNALHSGEISADEAALMYEDSKSSPHEMRQIIADAEASQNPPLVNPPKL